MKKQRNRKRVPHVCLDCGRIRHLQPSDAARTKLCQKCHCTRIAPLGFEATARIKGRDFAIRAAAQKRKQQPTTLEQQVEAALGEIPGIGWEREYTVERAGRSPYFVDFVIAIGTRRIALEVNGSFAHRHDDETNNLRMDTLFLFFDDVIVLTEDAIRQTANLPLYIQQLMYFAEP
jgi:hypothetical protein